MSSPRDKVRAEVEKALDALDNHIRTAIGVPRTENVAKALAAWESVRLDLLGKKPD